MDKCARILIVDDSRTFRAGLEAALNGEQGIVVAGSVFNGEKALEFIRAHPPDLVTLDVEMPGLDGLQVLEQIQRLNRDLRPEAEIGVLMLSAYTRRGADITVRALQAGAFDFVTKPSGGCPEDCIAQLRRDVLPRVRLFLARRSQVLDAGTRPAIAQGPAPPAAARRGAAERRNVQAVLIGCSTGGPKALATLLPDLARHIHSPVVIVQHMPAEFTRSLATSLARNTGLRVIEAEDGTPLETRTVYIAPGGRHMVLRRSARGELTAGTNDQPPECGCRPSASVLFRSAASVLGNAAVGVVLTGMGNDGTAGAGALQRAGGYVIAQDEATSVVWGMPGSAVAAGCVDAVLPLTEIASALGALSGRQGTG
jgi:two-component system chemotaxis response regulator CheB